MLDFHMSAFVMPLDASKKSDTQQRSPAVSCTARPVTGRMTAKPAGGGPKIVVQHARNILKN